jgi:hypothetical protein
MNQRPKIADANMLAIIAKGLLFGVARPITRLLGACGGKTHNGAETKTPIIYRFFSPIARVINWAAQGAITISQPSMDYDPIEWRKKRLASQWASRVTGHGY